MPSVRELISEARVMLSSDPDGVQVSVATALTALISAVEKLSADEFIVHAVQKLQLQPGDLLFVKLGDPNTGWFPQPDAVEKTARRFEQVIDWLGLTDKVVIQMETYTVEPGIIRKEQLANEPAKEV